MQKKVINNFAFGDHEDMVLLILEEEIFTKPEMSPPVYQFKKQNDDFFILVKTGRFNAAIGPLLKAQASKISKKPLYIGSYSGKHFEGELVNKKK